MRPKLDTNQVFTPKGFDNTAQGKQSVALGVRCAPFFTLKGLDKRAKCARVLCNPFRVGLLGVLVIPGLPEKAATWAVI